MRLIQGLASLLSLIQGPIKRSMQKENILQA
jgi:hypothetical protein